jgi:hypothetical protein
MSIILFTAHLQPTREDCACPFFLSLFSFFLQLAEGSGMRSRMVRRRKEKQLRYLLTLNDGQRPVVANRFWVGGEPKFRRACPGGNASVSYKPRLMSSIFFSLPPRRRVAAEERRKSIPISLLCSLKIFIARLPTTDHTRARPMSFFASPNYRSGRRKLEFANHAVRSCSRLINDRIEHDWRAVRRVAGGGIVQFDIPQPVEPPAAREAVPAPPARPIIPAGANGGDSSATSMSTDSPAIVASRGASAPGSTAPSTGHSTNPRADALRLAAIDGVDIAGSGNMASSQVAGTTLGSSGVIPCPITTSPGQSGGGPIGTSCEPQMLLSSSSLPVLNWESNHGLIMFRESSNMTSPSNGRIFADKLWARA